MIKEAIGRVVAGANLTEGEMHEAMDEIISGSATSAQIAAFITALRLKGETVDEITGAAKAMREKATKMNLNNHLVTVDRDEINVEDETILDTCGTGGEGTHTFNVSTATALVAAGGGVRVAKHGNRSVSSLCGSSDVLETLGVNLDITASDVERCIREVGIGFLYAPLFHSAMKHAVGPRQEIGIRTIFNLLGPLTNPAGASAQVLGVYEPGLTDKMACVLQRLGSREAFVVCGEGTFDEISVCGPTRVSHLKEGNVRTFEMTPEELGFTRAPLESIRGGNVRENAQIIRDIVNGEKGPKRDMVILNSAAAFLAAGLAGDFGEGAERAIHAVDSGRAREKLDRLIAFTQHCRPFIRDEC
ncbi:MAG: anthranilate phosphoribosyltransferase [Thermodesulfobacteriota bacterium]|nr:anthranilate phosphoribosyltransferase [Thermodesulfobacteriota bacterium]